MVCFPNSKINLGLNIVEKRSDGYHNIETIFYPVQWCDVLEVGSWKSEVGSFPIQSGQEILEEKINFSGSGLDVDGDSKNNLCVKAYELLKKDFQLPIIKMHLHKIIPMGAGLGGGSSDAAFTLKLLNELFALKLRHDSLKDYANQIGSDCAFFIDDVPAYASGRGEVLEKINLSLKGYFILIVKPEVHISTVEAYKMIKPQLREKSLKKIIQQPITDWKNLLKNDFEKSVFEKYPVIAEIKNNMYHQGAVYASMSGSGSAVYGIFDKRIFDKNVFKDCLAWEGILN
ncbi:MAG: 4-(cytidine 5'-diphospho)-2-C-methyl-D-erythritol kinase [Bacteroidia bacterium]